MVSNEDLVVVLKKNYSQKANNIIDFLNLIVKKDELKAYILHENENSTNKALVKINEIPRDNFGLMKIIFGHTVYLVDEIGNWYNVDKWIVIDEEFKTNFDDYRNGRYAQKIITDRLRIDKLSNLPAPLLNPRFSSGAIDYLNSKIERPTIIARLDTSYVENLRTYSRYGELIYSGGELKISGKRDRLFERIQRFIVS